MSFDWLQFLDRYQIEYVEKGPNVARGNVNVHCPWCGPDDPSHHMGISLEDEGFGCWRNRTHRGRNPARLIQALLNCSWAEAKRVAGIREATRLTEDSSFGERITSMMRSEPSAKISDGVLKFPKDIRPLGDVGSGRLFIDYLTTRLYTRDEAIELATRYRLRYALSGPFAYRIVVPVVMEEGLVNWTGRSITKNATLRYRTLSADPVKAAAARLPVARRPIDKTLWNYQRAMRWPRKTLVVCEGPFDALRVDFLGREFSVRATCLFGTGNLSPDQILLLERIRDSYDDAVLLLDRGAEMISVMMSSRLEYLRFRIQFVPEDVKDPGEFTRRHMKQLFR